MFYTVVRSAREVIVALAARPNRNKNIQLSNLSGVPLKAAYHGADDAITNTRTTSHTTETPNGLWETVFYGLVEKTILF